MPESCPAETPDGDRRTLRWFPGAILLLTVVAFALRLPGLTWGMPVVWAYNSDNERFVEDALRVATNRLERPRHQPAPRCHDLLVTLLVSSLVFATLAGGILVALKPSRCPRYRTRMRRLDDSQENVPR